MSEEKIDKRSKEYKDMIQANKDVKLKKEFEVKNNIKMQAMEKKMAEMEKLLRNVGTITASNAKKLTANSSNIDNTNKGDNLTYFNDIKKALGVKTSPKSRPVIIPRNDEYGILNSFVFKYASQIALDKKLVVQIGICLMYHRVDDLLEYIRRDDYLRDKALEEEIVSPDFKRAIVPQKK